MINFAQFLFTVVAGVSVFVMGQIFLRIFLDPLVQFRESVGRVVHLFLCNQARISNAHGDADLSSAIKKASADLLSKQYSIPFYRLMAFLFRQPPSANIRKACREINHVSNLILELGMEQSEFQNASQITLAMTEIERCLNTKIRYL